MRIQYVFQYQSNFLSHDQLLHIRSKVKGCFYVGRMTAYREVFLSIFNSARNCLLHVLSVFQIYLLNLELEDVTPTTFLSRCHTIVEEDNCRKPNVQFIIITQAGMMRMQVRQLCDQCNLYRWIASCQLEVSQYVRC